MVTLLLLLNMAAAPVITGADTFLLADSVERAGSYENASRLFVECAKESEPLRAYALSRAAENMAQAGNAAEAARLFQQVLKDHPEGPWARLTMMRLGRLHRKVKEYEQAHLYFSRVLEGLDPRPWFLNGLAKERAENALEVPTLALEGYAWFRDVAATTIYTSERLAAARFLLKSPDREDRLWGGYGLVRGGELKAARSALEAESPLLKDADGNSLALAALDACLAGDALDLTFAARCLNELVAANRASLAVRVWCMLALREQADAGRDGAAELLTNILLAYFAEGRDAGDACWLLAERYEKKAQTTAADRMYRLLAEKCPDHVRAPRSLYNLAKRARQEKHYESATAQYATLAEAFPGGQFAAESYYRCAQIAGMQNAPAEESRYLKLASEVGVGHFYAHRALHFLHRKGGATLASDRNLRIDGSDGFLQPMSFQEKHRLRLMQLIEHFPAYERVRFFGVHGLEEGEWEALECLLGAPDSLKKLWYPALAEAGYAHTALQHAVAEQWGIENGIPTLERRRLEYPLAYWTIVKQTAEKHGMDPFFLLAVARQESTFRAGIVSVAGATGVLQVMPETARWLARVDDRVSTDHVANLKSPLNSIHLGAVYMRRMLDRSGGNAVYGLASYNAGPGNCDKWRKRFPEVSLEAFMEAIPFSETNDYVKKVLANYAAYHSLYPEPAQAVAYTED